MLAQGDDIVPIPGTKRRKYLDENIRAADVTITAEDRAAIDQIMPPGSASGTRYPDAALKALNL